METDIMRSHSFPYIPAVTGRSPTRWVDTQAPVACRRCGEIWFHGDPALRMPCRACGARAGEPCRRRGGGNENVCGSRDQDAVRSGLLRPCDGLTWDGRHTKPLDLSASPIPGSLHCQSVRSGSPAGGIA